MQLELKPLLPSALKEIVCVCVCSVGLSVGFSVFTLGHAQFHGCLSPASSSEEQTTASMSLAMGPLQLKAE